MQRNSRTDKNVEIKSSAELRRLARIGDFEGQTAGQAPDCLQGNVVILPRKFAADFLLFCTNNPKPCPLIGLSKPGETEISALGANIDIRTDIPRYRIYRDGALASEETEITKHWRYDLVTFVLGCSFTFEEALLREGFGVRHIERGTNVPMFKTNIETIPGGIFNGPLVVTMRPYKKAEIPHIYDLSARFPHAHGTPVFWGDPTLIGINDLQAPDYGDPVPVEVDEVPVFWACGVTPQAAIERAQPPLCITHAPGHMLVTDVPSNAPPPIISGMTSFFDISR